MTAAELELADCGGADELLTDREDIPMPIGATAVLPPIMDLDTDSGDEGEWWPGSVWIGQIDAREVTTGPLVLEQGERFDRARLLVWHNDAPRGLVEVRVDGAVISGDELATEIAKLPVVDGDIPVDQPPFSVVVCTKDRPDQLRHTLGGLVDLDYPEFEIVVVDNGPASGMTQAVAAEFASYGVRLVDAERPGLSVARNVGVEAARHELIAFTDDDVVVDRNWLKGLARGFAREAEIACVSGMVPTAELLTPAQAYFDRRVSWASYGRAGVYRLSDPPDGDPLFPFRVARFGTGANFAVRGSAVVALGGFDEGLGVGSPAGGGEDIDMFVRVLLDGRTLAYEPAAVIWHRHRKSVDGLKTQIHDYGLGLGAWITKLLARPRTCGMVVRRAVSAVGHLRRVTVVSEPAAGEVPLGLEGLSTYERRGVLTGPSALLRSRIDGRQARPLLPGGGRRPEAAVLAQGLSTFAIVGGCGGALAGVSPLPAAVRLVLMAGLVLGLGAAVLSWYAQLPTSAVLALVPAVGSAIVVLATSGLLLFGVYPSVGVLLSLAGATVVGALARRFAVQGDGPMIALDTVLEARPATPAADVAVRRGRQPLPWIVLALAAAAFAYAATTIRTAAHTEYGLLATASPLLLASILLTALAFVIAVRGRDIRAAVAGVVLMIVVQRLPMAIGTDSPMYAWTFKHLGVVDYIQHEHALARGVDVYNGWPGAFGATAWLSELTGIAPVTFAQWFTPLFHVVFAVLVYAAARAWDLDRISAVTAAFITVTVNWVAQDYFSPQAIAMLLATAIIVVMGLSRTRPVGTLLIIGLFAALSITHQLTPVWILAAVGLLAVTRRLKPWWIFIPLTVMLAGYVAYNYDAISGFLDFSSDVVDNAKSNVPTIGSAGQQFTSLGVRALSGAVWLCTFVVLAIRGFRRQPFFSLGVVALSPMLILAQNYGGEAIFRVFLYSLVGCSIVLAPVLVAALQGNWRRQGIGAVAVVGAAALSAQGYFGGWFAYLLPKAEVDAVQSVLADADFPAYVSTPVPAWPQRGSWRYVDYARFADWYDHSFILAENLMGSHFDTYADYPRLTKMIGERIDASTYMVLSDQMSWYTYYFGVLPLDAIPNLKEKARHDPFWELVYDDGDVTVFRHDVKID